MNDAYKDLLGVTPEQAVLAEYVAMSPDKISRIDDVAFMPHIHQAHELNKIAMGE